MLLNVRVAQSLFAVTCGRIQAYSLVSSSSRVHVIFLNWIKLNGLNCGTHYLKVNVNTVMMEVFVFFPPPYHRLFREKEEDHSGLIKSLADLVLACLAKGLPVHHNVRGALGRRRYHPNGLTRTANAGTPGRWNKRFDRCRSTRSSQFLVIKISLWKNKKYAQ